MVITAKKIKRKYIGKINKEYNLLKNLSDEKITNLAMNLKEKEGFDVLIKSFALAKEAIKRKTGIVLHDEQLIGGIALSFGMIAELSTGAGKTVTAVAPLFYHALSNKSCHLVTVNDYLAKRDADELKEVYELLGLTIGYIIDGVEASERREIYQKDIVYITNSELGFDFLRDNMVKDVSERVINRPFNFCIIDEADSILIDEARTPLIIASASKEENNLPFYCNIFAKYLKNNEYTVDLKEKRVYLTEIGIKKAEAVFHLENYAAPINTILRYHVEQALKANYIMKKDKDYIVRNGEVILIDEHTGRVAEGRRFNGGLHQAIEAKEEVEIKSATVVHASITYQNFFKQYNKFSGMTGTAMTEKEEFKEIYNLNTIRIPDHKPCIRKDKEDLVYATNEARINAIVKETKKAHKKGQPVLIGTLDIEKSESLSKKFNELGIKHELLNAKQNEAEALIVSKAGLKGAVTIATNMAGRGTDIKLGPGVKKLGGLKIISSERAVDRRIDNQLIGRSGRQGDPGETQFFLSLDDELILQATKRNEKIIDLFDKDETGAIKDKKFSKIINSCQKKIEGLHFESRKETTRFDKILNNQRIKIYKDRNTVLESDCTKIVEKMCNSILTSESSKYNENELAKMYKTAFNIEATTLDEAIAKTKEKYENYLNMLQDKEKVVRTVMLCVIDTYWVHYMQDIEELRRDIKTVSYRGEDPLDAFNERANEMFNKMNYNIKRDIVRNILINI